MKTFWIDKLISDYNRCCAKCKFLSGQKCVKKNGKKISSPYANVCKSFMYKSN